VPNDRLRTTLRSKQFTVEMFASELGVDPKTVQRWLTLDRCPHRSTAYRAATLLDVPATWLWPELDDGRCGSNATEVVAFYPHRSETPKHLWLDLLVSARRQLWLLAYASLFLPEENPEAIDLIKHKAKSGVEVKIVLGDPDSPEAALRGREEGLFEAIPARIRMALAYYRPLVGVEGIEFHLHRTALYNSIFRFDDQMLINQHIFGAYGYVAPILHLRRVDGADLFETYAKSFHRIWVESYPYELPEDRLTADRRAQSRP
jgi:transcriptional regulator with XRE-family HTH domain